jgi:S-adenosylmethionine:tRNA ribosyltransferase-isomerase
LYFGEDDSLVAEVIDNTTSRGRTLRFLFDGPYEDFKAKITELGETPLPKYIKREVEPEDEERYQTIFAKVEGAVAAPTAGLHFSRQLLKRLELKGIDFAEVTLHVGLGTFRSVEVEDLTKHKMDSEQVIISQEASDMVNNAKRTKKRVCAVGTTAMRSIESSVSTEGYLKPFDGWTNKFIFPPYDFSIADSLITNFHTPLSTLLMMISAFAGHDLMMKAYQEAIKEKYRFYSYGDAMLIL